MPRDLEPSLNTRNFTLSALQNELRLDSRKLNETRPLTLSFGENPGSAYVELGKTKYISHSLVFVCFTPLSLYENSHITGLSSYVSQFICNTSRKDPSSNRILTIPRVLAQTSATITKPYDDSPFEGIFTITTEFSPMASSSFEPSRTGPYELVLSRTLDNTLRRARAIDLESLCILAKKLVWSVRVDVHFLDHDGGLVDAACVAVVGSLMSFRREDVEVRGEEVKVVWSLVPENMLPLYQKLFFSILLWHFEFFECLYYIA